MTNKKKDIANLNKVMEKFKLNGVNCKLKRETFQSRKSLRI